ncbi:hypothetical protein RHSIM_Rhsim07G0021400 [Rhododendron simsii]|uniref:Inositol-pentakisphosphate 2-kinase n=1 Tax=Rhododendron simsii TaxID=118357 RepID=A0A834LFG4_RHOSS|nr:hypothetical protein RHSIM_Rhsim07G0021400 [Rhododendron simsii]
MLLMLETLLWMEVVLELKDADDWIYRGEGAANLVLAYSGSSPTFVGKVLRIQKAPRIESPRNGYDSEDSHSALTNDECLLWRETEDLVSAPTREIAEQLYVQHVISPLLGYEHVDAGNRVFLSKEFLKAVEKNILSQRPSQRVDAGMVNAQCDFALLLSDHSVFPYGNYIYFVLFLITFFSPPLRAELSYTSFPPGNLQRKFCISVEIKVLSLAHVVVLLIKHGKTLKIFLDRLLISSMTDY